MSISFNAYQPRATAAAALPILFLHPEAYENLLLRALVSCNGHRVFVDWRRGFETWKKLEGEFNSSSIGLIADASGAAFQILSEGFAGAPLPGAIALLGWTSQDLEGLLRVSEPLCFNRQRNAKPPVFEWPELRVILACDDPNLGPSARMVRKLRAQGVPIGLEVVSELPEIAEELERFFATYLTPIFPKMN